MGCSDVLSVAVILTGSLGELKRALCTLEDSDHRAAMPLRFAARCG